MVDFEALFEDSPNPYMVVDRDLRFVAANRAYREVTSHGLDELLGKRLTDVFPHDPADLINASRVRLEESLRRVLETGERDVLPVIHYRITVDGAPQDHYWSATHTPLRDGSGKVAYVLQHTVNVTALQRSRATELQVGAGVLGRAALIQDTLRRVLALLEQAPGFFAFLRGPEHVFELANKAYSKMVGGRTLVGMPLREALPNRPDVRQTPRRGLRHRPAVCRQGAARPAARRRRHHARHLRRLCLPADPRSRG